jgi:hypothetical protein
MNDPLEIAAALEGASTDLDLLAFRYLMDDLSAAAKAAFELRLASEQPAREALARAVELSLALKQTASVQLSRAEAHVVASQMADSSSVANSRSFGRWMRGTAYVAIASAACLALVIGMRAISRAWENQSSLLPETALAWSQVRDSWPESSVAETLNSATNLGSSSSLLEDGDADALTDEANEVEANELETNSDLPAWLLTAVAGSAEADEANEEPNGSDVGEDRNSPDREDL